MYYMFPPFSVIPKVLQKIDRRQGQNRCSVTGSTVAITQSWWPSILKLVVGPCLLMPIATTILSLPHKPKQQHPLKKMRLILFPKSGKHFKQREFQTAHQTSFCNHGEHQQSNNIIDILTRGPRGPWNAHLRQKIFKSSLFSLLYVQQAKLGGLNLKAIVLKFKSNVCKRTF